MFQVQTRYDPNFHVKNKSCIKPKITEFLTTVQNADDLNGIPTNKTRSISIKISYLINSQKESQFDQEFFLIKIY